MTGQHSSNSRPSGSPTAARLLLILVAVMWSTSGFFAKAPWLEQWPLDVRGPLLAFWRTLFAGLCLLPLVRRPQWSWRMVPAALIFAVMNVTYLTAVTKTTAANAIWLQNTAPFWVFLVNVVWLREAVEGRDWLMLLFAMSGVSLILLFEFQTQQTATSRSGVLWGVAGGLTYAGVILTVSSLRHLDSAWIIAVNHLVTAALLAPYVVRQDIWPTAGQAVWLAAFGVFQMGVPYMLFARALRSVKSHEAAGIILLEPVLVPLWVYLAWHSHASYQAPAWWTLAGGGLILAGLVLRYLGRGPKCASLKPHSTGLVANATFPGYVRM